MGKRGSKLAPELIEELVTTTHFSHREVLQWYRGFLKECPSGIVDEKKFCRIYAQFFPFGNSSSFASITFKSFDIERKGFIEFKEFLKCLSISTRGSVDEKLTWSFTLYDINKDGYISKDDIITVIDAMHKMTGQLAEIDTRGTCTPQERLQTIFDTMDEDGDGLINLIDFINGAKTDSGLISSISMTHTSCV